MPLSHLGAEPLLTPLPAIASARHQRLGDTVHGAFDRMAMQSDLRDLYQSVRLIGFADASPPTTSNASSSSLGVGDHRPVVAELALQLSDNDDQRHLVAVFRDYLRANNNSVGGTDLYAADEERLDVYGGSLSRSAQKTLHSVFNPLLMRFLLLTQTLTSARTVAPPRTTTAASTRTASICAARTRAVVATASPMCPRIPCIRGDCARRSRWAANGAATMARAISRRRTATTWWR